MPAEEVKLGVYYDDGITMIYTMGRSVSFREIACSVTYYAFQTSKYVCIFAYGMRASN